MNPLWVDANAASYKQILTHQPDVFADTPWTYWDDLVTIFGVDPKSNKGYARRTWDNVGVQYGLTALLSGQISKSEFIALNAKVGGFIAPDDMVQEGFPFGSQDPQDFDVWSARNTTASLGLPVSPRTEADIGADPGAPTTEGLVFLGDIDRAHHHHPPLPRARARHAQRQAVLRRPPAHRSTRRWAKHDNHLIWAISAQAPTSARPLHPPSRSSPPGSTSQQKPAAAVDPATTAGLSRHRRR
jgi:hypothetical protein